MHGTVPPPSLSNVPDPAANTASAPNPNGTPSGVSIAFKADGRSNTATNLHKKNNSTIPKVALNAAVKDLQPYYESLDAKNITWTNFTKIISGVAKILPTIKEDISTTIAAFQTLTTTCQEHANKGNAFPGIEIETAKTNLRTLGCKDPCCSCAPICCR